MVDLGKLDIMVKRPECDLCSLFVLGCKQVWRDADWDDEATRASTTLFLGALDPSRQRPNGYKLQISAIVGGRNWQWIEFEITFRDHGSAVKPVDRSYEVCPTIDIDFVRKSLQECVETHAECGNKGPTMSPNRLCLIDLNNMSIGPAPESCEYAALSYVWGRITEKWLTLTKEGVTPLSKKGSLRGAHLPQTVMDARQLCMDLKERYLWVDALCIVQNDPESQKQQIDIMDSIYASAKFTIVAAAGNHANSGLPGISTWLRRMQKQAINILDVEISNTIPRLQDTAEVSVWNSRGWTFQERMFSMRCIFLTEAQAYFGCNAGVAYERPNRLLPEPVEIERMKGYVRSGTSLAWYEYVRDITKYTLRSLTSQADILRAFQGVMNDISRRHKLNFHFGLPDKHFIDALLWQQAAGATRRIASGVTLPSWSWTSTNGAIKYSFMEERLTPNTITPIPGFWKDGEEPEMFQIDWFLTASGPSFIHLRADPAAEYIAYPRSAILNGKEPPEALLELALRQPGRLLFSTQLTTMFLQNSVPYKTIDNMWTDYTQDVDQSNISIVSILFSRDATEPAGFIELDKIWASENLNKEPSQASWSFIALSLSTSKVDDIMNRWFTQRRRSDIPMVLSRNVCQLVVNVMLVQWNSDVATRSAVGKIYLDYWEAAKPETRWMVLE